MAFDKRAYNDQYNKEQTKLKAVRYTLHDVQEIEAYCAWKDEGYSELVKRLVRQEMDKDGWQWSECKDGV